MKTVATLSLEISVTTTSVDSVMIQLVMPIRTGLIVLLKMGWQVIEGVSTTTTVVFMKVVVYLHARPILRITVRMATMLIMAVIL